MKPAAAGLFPLDEQLAVWERHWSEQVAKQAVWLSGLVTFDQAAQILTEIGQLQMSDTSIWRRVERWGQRGHALEVAQRVTAMACPPRPEVLAREPAHLTDMGVALDGAMVHLRAEGWKELKVGCVFEVEQRPTREPQTGDLIEMGHAVRNSYVAHLGGPEVFGHTLWAEARQRAWIQARDTVALGDGATWVWNLVSEHFYDSRQGVDWYHAAEHLMRAAHLLKGDGTPAARQWFHEHDTLLFEGHADQVATRLRAATTQHPKVAEDLRREAAYFQTNQRRMQYLELREDGFPIGSGMVESACKQFRARFAGPGMRWSRPGLERLLPIRAAVMSHRFEAWWSAVYKPPLN